MGDDAKQAARARRLIDTNDIFICTTVLLETEWLLRSVYRFSAAQCAKALSDFAGLPRANLEDASAAAKALGWMRQGVDFADAPHLKRNFSLKETLLEAFQIAAQALPISCWRSRRRSMRNAGRVASYSPARRTY